MPRESARQPHVLSKTSGVRNDKIRLRLIITIPVLMMVFPIMSGVLQYQHLVGISENVDSRITRIIMQETLDYMIVTNGALILIAAGCGILLAQYITSPINKLISTLDEIAKGDFQKQIDIHTQDELSLLGSSFNQMVSSLKKTIEERNRYILECYTGGLITVDLNGRVSAANSAAEQILEEKGEDLMGIDFIEYLQSRSDTQTLIDICRDCIHKGNFVQSRELSICTKDGKPFPLMVTTSVLRGKSGEQQGTIINFRDLTKFKAFHQRLSRTDRLATAGTLAMGVAHEIRNPLASIRGMAQLLHQDLPDDSPQRKFSDIIISESRRLDQVVSELLDFTQPDQADQNRCEFNELLSRALNSVKARCKEEEKEIAFEESYGELPPQQQYPEKMIQAFSNILNNAVQAVPTLNGHISVRTSMKEIARRNGHAHKVISAEIANNGPQIPEEDLERIFEPFYTRREGGSGLGLPIAYQIVTFHGGQIEVDSDPHRTAFTVQFPLR